MAAIYGLVSNRSNEVFYVGQTYRDPDARFYEHYWNTKASDAPLYAIIKEERRSGFDIYCEVLEWCSFDRLDEREVHWISSLPNLINKQLARLIGYNSLSQQEHERVEAIRHSRRGGLPNWCGHIGMLYFPRYELWDVQIFHWGNFKILGRYRDGVETVAARDAERRRLDKSHVWGAYTWPTDREYPFETDPDDMEVAYAFPHVPPLLTPEADEFLSTAEFMPMLCG
jgi:hypothetical protein